jgi:hypothetical protein
MEARAEVPHDACASEQPERVIAHVDLPPANALAHGAHLVVMVVVPAFAERDHRKERVVA